MGRLFGTDGVRGIANKDLSAELACNMGVALAMVLRERNPGKPRVILGKDTRASSDMLESAVAAGLCAGGADVVLAGVVPTPAVAYLVTSREAQAGVMISASHNPYHFNGIKVFGPGGYKLSDEEEAEIEEILLDHSPAYTYAPADQIGQVTRDDGAVHEYVRHIASTVKEDLSGLRVLVDCANGSASATAAELFAALGVDAHIIHSDPDGINVNHHCGSTHVEELCPLVKEGKYDLAVAFDGDADRCLAVDEAGRVVNGDQMIAIFATDMKASGTLKNDTAVVTVMSNFGFFKFARENGIHTRTTKVGDRYVLETMLEEGHNIGGEQSGHIIFTDYMTTGDGQLSAVQLLAALKRSGKPLGQLCGIITILPQVLINVEADRDMKAAITESPELNRVIRQCEEQLGDSGRVLLRPSGTEPLIRVMVEGEDMAQIDAIAHTLADAIKTYLP